MMDVTFHPVAPGDVQRFLFDVADHLPLAATRAMDLLPSEHEKKKVSNLYKEFLVWRAEVPRREALGEVSFAGTYARTMAVIAGFRHPYWYVAKSSLSALAREDEKLAALFKPLGKFGTGRLNTVPDRSKGLLAEREAGSGVITDLAGLRRELERLRKPRVRSVFLGLKKQTLPGLLDEYFSPEALDSLHRAIAYAEARGLALMEASGIAAPGRSGASRYSNLRASELGALDENALPPALPGEEPLSPPIPFVAPQASGKIAHLPLTNAAGLFDVRESASDGGLFSGKEELSARIGFAPGEAPDEKVRRLASRLAIWKTKHGKRCAQVAITCYAPQNAEQTIFEQLQKEFTDDHGLMQFVNTLGRVTLTFVQSAGESRRLVWGADETGRRTFLEEIAA
jgi:hypothetical protein